MATHEIKDLIPATASRPEALSLATKPSISEWRPEGFDTSWPADEGARRSLESAVDLCRRFAGRAEAHADSVQPLRAAGEVVSDVHPSGAGWLTLSGAYGCGKTSLAGALFRRLSRVDPFANGVWLAGTGEFREDSRRPGCVFLHVNAFIDRTLGGDYRFPEYLGREWLVVVDDLGANRQGSENSREAASDAISRLCCARTGKMTVFTTNWTVAEIASRVDGRVASRLIRDADGNAFHRITAGDYALRTKR